ncbi:ABC transporter ATP-binding protein [Roseburia rectibacter]|uniref:ABC transporter ATP-binding protein n=1 Tax=Roseburia rectibacter TaxID=2763062 RepID=UPI001F13E043|nr:ABC transporter ATP-binding protein [Roseburia rectibacter]UMZ01804.1 ABC transporter ATP-binding protein [Roseburia rectibacter]
MCVNEKEVYEICMSVDSIIADKLTESIVVGTSYDMLEAHYGILPISKNCFYRKRRIVQKFIEQKRSGRTDADGAVII